jgi:predicted membrane channel-forming protein YqfA (hemolysin III family)
MTTVETVRETRGSWRVGVVMALTLPILLWVAAMDPVPQPVEYHQFADQRTLFGLPHFWNVVSNLPFAVVGLYGCWWLLHRGPTSAPFADPRERTAYLVFFIGDFLTCFGSAWYHAAPSNDTLVWDRLFMSLMLGSIFAIVVTEFISPRIGRRMLAPMVAIGVGSVLYWAYSESIGRGDLRLYLLVQFYPMLAIPPTLILFESRYTLGSTFWILWGLYGLAKVAEIGDARIREWTGVWSGHTVKHLIAAGASVVPLISLQRRRRR